MTGSWRIGTLSGIGVYVHWSFAILLVWVGWRNFEQGKDFVDALQGLVFMAALFSIIVLHEMGHALAARHYGIPTRDITLLPIGGVARLDRMPEDPLQELVVAIAGPAVNVVLAGLCILGIVVLVGAAGLSVALGEVAREFGFAFQNHANMPLLSNLTFLAATFLVYMLFVNVMLVVFNLLPAFPMDGGRVLRSLLALKWDYVQATQAAATVGKGMALLFGLYGFFHNPFLVLIALFVWNGASSEASMVRAKAWLQSVSLSDAMITQFRTLAPGDPVGAAAEYVEAGLQHDFPVVENGLLVGLLTNSALLKSMADSGGNDLAGNVMRRQFLTADPAGRLETVLGPLQAGECQTIPVVRNGLLFGIVTVASVREFLARQKAVRGDRK